MKGWNENHFWEEPNHVKWLLRSAPDWNAGYFTSRMENENMETWLRVLDDVRGCKDKCEYRIDQYNKVITVYDNDASEMFHYVKEHDVTELVFQRLREGKPVPPTPPEPKWVGANDVWST